MASTRNIKCACCPNVPEPSHSREEPTVGLTEEEMVWSDGKHTQITSPDVIKYLDTHLQTDHVVVEKLATNYGCCSSFRILSDEGIRAMDLAVASIEKYAVSCPRIPKVLRGGTFRSKFLNGMAHSEAVLRHVSQLAGCEMIYHPMKIQQLHINFKPDDDSTDKKNIDRWHCDTTPFVLIVFATDPDEYTGGQLQYFEGTREEGMQLLGSGAGLPKNRVLDVGRQSKGYGVFVQGWRVFHQVTPVLSGNARTTLVYSFQPRNVLALEACQHLSQGYNKVDPLDIFSSDWARYRAWKTAMRMELCQEHCQSALESNAALREAVAQCGQLMCAIVQTLPYSDNRQLMQSILEAAVAPLRAKLSELELDLDLLGKDFEVSPYGLENLKMAVVDIDNSVQDILTLKDTTMVYF